MLQAEVFGWQIGKLKERAKLKEITIFLQRVCFEALKAPRTKPVQRRETS